MLLVCEISNEQISDNFNDYFTSIASNLVLNLPSTNNDHKYYLNTPNVNSIFLRPATTNEVISTIYALNNKSTHHSEVPMKVYKQFSSLLAYPITVIFNMNEFGVFPDILKMSRVAPVFKKGDTYSTNNYRPISNLNNLNKIFEKLIYKRLYSFLDRNNILSTNQYGFRKGLSTEDAVNYLITNVYNYLNVHQYVGAVFLDLSKAFDTISHDILISKLEYYGIRGKCLNLLESYLQNRHQYVCVNGTKSCLKPVSLGVPQGSILGPLLFLIYINDLPSVVNYSDCLLYADDTTLFYNESNLNLLCKRLSEDMELVHNWLTSNKLIINTNKTKFLVFTNKNIPPNTSLTFNNFEINLSYDHNFLGIHLDNHLSFKQHIRLISGKVSKTIGILCKIKNFVPSNILRTIYFSLIQPYLSYGISVWGAARKSNIKPLATLQKRSVRLINNSNYYDHTNPLFYNLNILKLGDMYKIRCLKYMYNVILLGKFNFIQSFILHSQVFHGHETRCSDLRLPTVRKYKFKQSLIYNATYIWNIYKSVVTIDKGIYYFLRQLKKNLIEQYNIPT